MSNLKDKFTEAAKTFRALEGAIANELTALTAAFEQEKAGLIEKHEAELADLKNSYEEELESERLDFRKLKNNADRALDLCDDVDAEIKGMLPIERLPLKILFEKLEGRWESLTASEIEMIEEVLDRKVIRV